MQSTALFIDTFTRKVKVSTVSVTEVSGRGLVLRFGAEVGNLYHLTRNGEIKNEDLPILLATRGYRARSSAGSVEVLVNNQGNHNREIVIGIQGMPWQHKKGLTVLSSPMEVLVLQPGTNISQVLTHSSGERQHSNPATAHAATTGILLRSQTEPKSVFVIEGQSDQTKAWKLAPHHLARIEGFIPQWPEEHRSERFSDEVLLEKVLTSYGQNERDQLYALAVMVAAYSAQKPEEAETFRHFEQWAAQQSIYRLLGERVSFDYLMHAWSSFSLAKAKLEMKLQEGFQLRVHNPQSWSDSDTPIEVVSPNGESSMFFFPARRALEHSQEMQREKVEEMLLIFATNSDEEKIAFLSGRSA